MTVGKAIRWLLGWGAFLVVVWSFFSVGLRLYRQEHDRSDHRTQLVILQWGDASEERPSFRTWWTSTNGRIRTSRFCAFMHPISIQN